VQVRALSAVSALSFRKRTQRREGVSERLDVLSGEGMSQAPSEASGHDGSADAQEEPAEQDEEAGADESCGCQPGAF